MILSIKGFQLLTFGLRLLLAYHNLNLKHYLSSVECDESVPHYH